MYIVHMKRTTASEARRNWFRILDEVAAGETVSLERNGRRILIVAAEESAEERAVPDYSCIIDAPDAADADKWSWAWRPEEDLAPTVRPSHQREKSE